GAGVATAKGLVRVVDGEGNTLTGHDLRMDLKKETAVITNTRIFYKRDNLHITAGQISKTGPRSFQATETAYTTCDCEDEQKSPAWAFRTSAASVTVGRYLTGWNSRFYIKGVPVLYFPYIKVPVNRERQSGLLQPGLGYSELRGFAIENSLYWAISESTDATFYLDVETNRGVGEGVEYRYIRTSKSFGQLYFNHFKERKMERVRSFRAGVDNLSRPANATNTRWQFRMNHTEALGDGIKLRADINLVSDDEYLLDFGSGADRTRESIENNISLSKDWGAYSLVGQLRYFNNLLNDTDETTLHKLPEITLTGTDTRLFSTPLYLSSETGFVNFSRKKGVAGQRLDIRPKLSLPMSAGGYIDITPSIAPRATLYLTEDHPGNAFRDRYLYEINVDATTSFVRVFHPEMNNGGTLRHIIRPRLSYTYIPQAVQSDLPQFDAVDNIVEQNTLAYSLVSVLTGKSLVDGEPVYRQYAYFDVRQSYDINEATRKLLTPQDRNRPFSDLRAELLLEPTRWMDLSALGEYDVYDHWFNSYNASLAASDERGDSLKLDYRFVRAEATRYLEASARVQVMRPVDFTYLMRYSFDEGRALETSYTIEYRHQCWSSTLTYTDRLEEKVIYLSFDLLGLGRVAGIEGVIEPL
ncbi:MAG: LPS-assembly protein LptD, partial [Thermodesulfobacteriota bacterium]